MKKLLVTLVFTGLMLSLTANPIILKAIARVWFNDLDEFIVLLSDESVTYGMPIPFEDLVFSTSSGVWQFPDGFSVPGVPYQVNLSQVIPGFTIDKNADQLLVQCDGGPGAYEMIRWDNLIDPAPDIRPLLTAQAAVQFRVVGNMMWSVDIWGKDNVQYHLPAHEVVARCMINVHVQDYTGNPFEGLEVVRSYQNYIEQNYYHQFYTDENGNVSMESFPCRIRIGVKDPVTEAWVLDESVYCEPGETYNYTATVTHTDTDDHVLPVVQSLSIWPSVMGSQSSNFLKLKGPALNSAGELRLYDLRGRYLCSQIMPITGETQWRLPDLESGIYFVKLVQGGQNLGSARFTVLK